MFRILGSRKRPLNTSVKNGKILKEDFVFVLECVDISREI